MKFRPKHVFPLLFAASCLALISGCTTTKKAEPFKQGLHYQHISPEQQTQAPKGKIEVVEMFFYGCPHCYELEPKIKHWAENHRDTVYLRRMPAIVGPSWITHAKAYYIAEQLGILDKFHRAFFESIHKQGEQYYNDYALMKFFLESGVTADAFNKANQSSILAEKLNQARIMTVKYGLRGVPAFIVNGKYKTAPFYTRTQEEMISVLDQLIAEELIKSDKQ